MKVAADVDNPLQPLAASLVSNEYSAALEVIHRKTTTTASASASPRDDIDISIKTGNADAQFAQAVIAQQVSSPASEYANNSPRKGDGRFPPGVGLPTPPVSPDMPNLSKYPLFQTPGIVPSLHMADMKW